MGPEIGMWPTLVGTDPQFEKLWPSLMGKMLGKTTKSPASSKVRANLEVDASLLQGEVFKLVSLAS